LAGNTLTIEEITGAILSGDVDADIDKVYQAYRERSKLARAVKSAQNKILLKVGDKVRIGGIRPKALNGCTGTINGVFTSGSFSVKLDPPLPLISGIYNGVVNGIPAVCLEKIA